MTSLSLICIVIFLLYIVSVIGFDDEETLYVADYEDDRYHPTDFVHGLLAAHSYEDKCGVGDSLLALVTSNTWRAHDYFNVSRGELKDAVMARVFANWTVLRILDDVSATGYFGIIYKNEARKQLVLAHRGTAVLGSVVEDIDGVLGGRVTPFQMQLKRATKVAVDLVVAAAAHSNPNHSDYALSFTGHSLGGWLADLSVYYCHQLFGYKNVKAVTFEAPGSEFMINANLELNAVKGAHDTFRAARDLDIVAYCNMPNVINSCNRHIGSLYLLEETEDDAGGGDGEESSSSSSSTLDLMGKGLGFGGNPGKGHSFMEILPKFEPCTGRPRTAVHKALRWPSITLVTATPGEHEPRHALHLTLLVLKDWLLGNIALGQFKRISAHRVRDTRHQVEIHVSEFLVVREDTRAAEDTRKRVDTIDTLIVELLAAATSSQSAGHLLLDEDVRYVRRACKYDRLNEELVAVVPHRMSDVRDRARRVYHRHPRLDNDHNDNDAGQIGSVCVA